MSYYLQIDRTTNRVQTIITTDSVISDSPHLIVEIPEFSIDKLDMIYSPETGEFYRSDDLSRLPLDEYKDSKKAYLEQLADTELQSGFSSTVSGVEYFFVYDQNKAQPRFTKQATEVAIYPDPALYPPIDQIEWATDKGFQIFTRDQFIGILKDLASHEKTISFKLLYAQAHIDNAQNKDEVDAIVASW